MSDARYPFWATFRRRLGVHLGQGMARALYLYRGLAKYSIFNIQYLFNIELLSNININTVSY